MDKDQFRVTFFGVRGSIPSPMVSSEVEEKIQKAVELAQPADLKDEASRRAFVARLPHHVKGCFGGNSSCIHVEVNGKDLIFDCGTGLRMLGNLFVQREFGKGEGEASMFLSHTHWDHIMGIPFFTPFYVKGNKFKIYGSHPRLEERLIGQQSYEYFPVAFESFSADIEIISLDSQNDCTLGDVRITWLEMDHPGSSFAYRVEYQGKTFIYATDAEYKKLGDEDLKPTIDFFRNADLLIFDSQYTFIEGVEREDWGHSSTFIGVDIALMADVKKIAFFHHEPSYSDLKLQSVLEQTQKYLKALSKDSPLEMFLSREGMSLDLL